MPVVQQEHPVAQQGEAVTVPVAARRLGRSPDAIRSAIRRGKISARKGNDGEWLVFLPPAGAADQPVKADGLALLADSLRAELEQERQQSADRTETTIILRERVARLEGEATGHVARIGDLHNALADLASRLDRATAELAEVRRPWWRRMLG